MKKHLIPKLLPLVACFSLLVLSSTATALNIEYTATGANALQINAFEQAVQRWENRITTPITVNLDFSFVSMGTGNEDIIGSTMTDLYAVQFTDVKNQLDLYRVSTADDAALDYINSLPMTGSNYDWYSNDQEYGSTWADNLNIYATSANLKALGYNLTGTDAEIEFNSDFAFDYKPLDADGVANGTMDFIGVATHEIGHALGFISIVDVNSTPDENPPTIFDLFRHSDDAGIIDISIDGRDAFFSHDNGLTQIALSTGDPYQASHWADDLGLGIMDPTADFGEFLSINRNDMLAFDVIGWTVTPVPEPSTMLLLGTGLLALAGKRKKFKSDGFSA